MGDIRYQYAKLVCMGVWEGGGPGPVDFDEERVALCVHTLSMIHSYGCMLSEVELPKHHLLLECVLRASISIPAGSP